MGRRAGTACAAYRGTVLHGREKERIRLADVWDRTRAGEATSVLLLGDAGVGKSVLLDDLAELAGDARVLRTVGLRAETALAFAGLHRLLHPVLDLVPHLPGPQQRALRRAFGEVDGDRLDPFLVSLATLTLVTELAEQGPVLCLVDDLQWLDASSADVVLFVARRLLADPVATVLAARDEPGFEPPLDVPELVVGGISPDAVRSILRERTGQEPSERLVEVVTSRTGGNPLAVVELPAHLSPAHLDGTAVLPPDLPLSARVERAFLERCRQLSPDGQTLLLLAAADDAVPISVLQSAAERLGVPATAWTGAESAGLLLAEGEVVRVQHPLVRSAVYQAATALERRTAHAALADALLLARDADRHAWHRGLAALAPDEDVARLLEEVAGRAERRGGHEAASSAYERSARLSEQDESTAMRLPRRRAQRLHRRSARQRRLAAPGVPGGGGRRAAPCRHRPTAVPDRGGRGLGVGRPPDLRGGRPDRRGRGPGPRPGDGGDGGGPAGPRCRQRQQAAAGTGPRRDGTHRQCAGPVPQADPRGQRPRLRGRLGRCPGRAARGSARGDDDRGPGRVGQPGQPGPPPGGGHRPPHPLHGDALGRARGRLGDGGALRAQPAVPQPVRHRSVVGGAPVRRGVGVARAQRRAARPDGDPRGCAGPGRRPRGGRRPRVTARGRHGHPAATPAGSDGRPGVGPAPLGSRGARGGRRRRDRCAAPAQADAGTGALPARGHPAHRCRRGRRRRRAGAGVDRRGLGVRPGDGFDLGPCGVRPRPGPVERRPGAAVRAGPGGVRRGGPPLRPGMGLAGAGRAPAPKRSPGRRPSGTCGRLSRGSTTSVRSRSPTVRPASSGRRGRPRAGGTRQR